jgi:hypothetical protein
MTLRWKKPVVACLALLLSGCVSEVEFGDPQLTGAVPVEAQNWGIALVGYRGKAVVSNDAKQPGTVIVVAGLDPIFKQAVAANDDVQVEAEYPLIGDCQIRLKVNGVVVNQAASKVSACRIYFVPSEAPGANQPVTSAENR